jgi:hypothetical protein
LQFSGLIDKCCSISKLNHNWIMVYLGDYQMASNQLIIPVSTPTTL